VSLLAPGTGGEEASTNGLNGQGACGSAGRELVGGKKRKESFEATVYRRHLGQNRELVVWLVGMWGRERDGGFAMAVLGSRLCERFVVGRGRVERVAGVWV
jgi:hypothetical protein